MYFIKSDEIHIQIVQTDRTLDIKQCTLKTELRSNSNKDYIQIKKYLEKIKTMISEINLAIRKSKPMGIKTQQNFLTR